MQMPSRLRVGLIWGAIGGLFFGTAWGLVIYLFCRPDTATVLLLIAVLKRAGYGALGAFLLGILRPSISSAEEHVSGNRR